MKINKGKLEIDIEEIVDGLSEDEKKQLIKSACISPEVIKWVMDWICGEDEDGWWTSTEYRLREGLLARVENTQLSKVTHYNWSLIEAATKRLKQLESDKALYWALYHHPEKYNTTIEEFLKGKDGWNEIYTTVADKKIEEVVNLVKDAVKPK